MKGLLVAAALLPVSLPGGGAGIGFDDLGFASGLGKVLVPGGRTGELFLVDPGTRKAEAVGGFSAGADYQGGHGEGVTTADEGRGLLFACDRNAVTVNAVDPKTRKIVASAKLGGNPDYVRWVQATGETWVSEPDSERIEIFALGGGTRPALTLSGVVAVPGGPESLIIDTTRGRAYTHSWKSKSFAVGLKSRTVDAAWDNGCEGSRGIALDEKKGFLFAACVEGKAVVLDAAHDGKILSSLKAGDGVDVIAYNPGLRHLYVPGAKSATMAVMSVSDTGTLSLARSYATAKGAHCAAADDKGGAWVCDPDHGRLLFLKDQ